MQKKPFPKTELIRKALGMMPADRPREAVSIYGWLCNDGNRLIPRDLAITLDDVEQLLPRVIGEGEK